MDRRLLAGWLAVLVTCGACSSKSNTGSDAAATAPQPQASSVDMPPPASVVPATAEPERTVTATLNGSAAIRRPTATVTVDPSAPRDTAEPSLAPGSGDFSQALQGPPRDNSALNPLRLDFEPKPEAALRGNPLRTMSEPPELPTALPRAAAPTAAAPSAPPLDDLLAAPTPSPSGGSSPMAEEPFPTEANAGDAKGAIANAQGVAATGSETAPFDEVEVFYGTDRQSSQREPVEWSALALRFVPLCISGMLTFCVGLIAAGRRSFGLALLALVGLGASVGLGYQASAGVLAVVRASGSVGPRYTSDRASGGRVEIGVCKVTIPRTHKLGEVESPSITRLEIRPDAWRHVVLQKTERLMDESFYRLLRQRTMASSRRELFVFIHGFNVSFEDAARRTAQIHYDLKFEGAPIFFSWPANNKFVLTYGTDGENVAWSVPHLKQFLLSIVNESQAKSINLIAHSMGNRGLTAALREIDLEMRDQRRLFNQVILAAPDIDADEFRSQIAPAMQRTARQFTLYASARDDALLASQLVNRGPRAGDAGNGLVVVPGIDTIDVTAIDSSPWGHSYYGSSDPVLNDLRALFTGAIPARERSWLTPAQSGELTYWIFQPLRTATTSGEVSRQ